MGFPFNSAPIDVVQTPPKLFNEVLGLFDEMTIVVKAVILRRVTVFPKDSVV
jgi:hypothetical protein